MNRPHFSTGGCSWRPLAGRHSDRPSLSDAPPPRTEIEYLRRLLRQELPMTDARLAELRDRVAKGVFLTRQAAEATASRLIDDNFDLQ